MTYAYTNAKGNTYYLHKKIVTLKGGREQALHFFAKTVKEGAISEVPDGYQVAETKNGLPVLKKAVSG